MKKPLCCLKRGWFKLVVLISPLVCPWREECVKEAVHQAAFLLLWWFVFCFLLCLTKLRFVCEFGGHHSHTLNRQYTLHRPIPWPFYSFISCTISTIFLQNKKQLEHFFFYLFTFHTFFQFSFPHFFKKQKNAEPGSFFVNHVKYFLGLKMKTRWVSLSLGLAFVLFFCNL